MSVLFIVGSQLNEGKVVGSCAARDAQTYLFKT